MIFMSLSIAVLFISSAASFQFFGTTDRTIETTAKYGDSVQFKCYDSDTPPHIIKWKKRDDGGEIRNFLLPNGKTQHEGNILQIPSVTQFSQGEYECRAFNVEDMKQVHYQNFILSVMSKPWIIKTHHQNLFNSHIKLECVAIICLKYTFFKWYKNGELLTNDDKHKVENYGYGFYKYMQSSLEISMENNDWEGSYKCENKNDFGKDERIFEINNKDFLEVRLNEY